LALGLIVAEGLTEGLASTVGVGVKVGVRTVGIGVGVGTTVVA